MKFSGFTDEAADDLAGQIQVTKDLGWQYLSARTFNGKNIHDLPEREFDHVIEILDESGVSVAEFGTLIGNWAKKIDSDFDITIQEVARCIPRMQKMGVKYARIMSYAQEPWGDDQHRSERFRRLREITKRFMDAGLVPLHENCMNYGGFSANHTLRLIDSVPDLKLVFDTGNPIFQRDRSKSEPFPWQDSWEFYQKVKHAVVHIHVKDARMKQKEGEPVYKLPGEGDARLDLILSDLIHDGYDGFLAIEPHLGKVFHLSDDATSDGDHRYNVYLEAGRKLEKMVENIRQNTLA
ncbi:MAG: sugar phosphate isomerase/epimerase [Cytophagales bacterium]|nr:sugar phosphate isomerase/epimerase [Cytophagales bacterium]